MKNTFETGICRIMTAAVLCLFLVFITAGCSRIEEGLPESPETTKEQVKETEKENVLKTEEKTEKATEEKTAEPAPEKTADAASEEVPEEKTASPSDTAPTEVPDEMTLLLTGHYWYNGTGSMNIMVFDTDGTLKQYNVKNVIWDTEKTVDASKLLPENINLTGTWQLRDGLLIIDVKDAKGSKGPFTYGFHTAGAPSTGVGEDMAREHEKDNYFYELETVSYDDGMWASQPYDLLMFGAR